MLVLLRDKSPLVVWFASGTVVTYFWKHMTVNFFFAFGIILLGIYVIPRIEICISIFQKLEFEPVWLRFHLKHTVNLVTCLSRIHIQKSFVGFAWFLFSGDSWITVLFMIWWLACYEKNKILLLFIFLPNLKTYIKLRTE